MALASGTQCAEQRCKSGLGEVGSSLSRQRILKNSAVSHRCLYMQIATDSEINSASRLEPK